MSTGTAFTVTIGAGATVRYFNHSWDVRHHVIWYLMPVSPQPGGPQLDWDIAVERISPALCTYWITVRNLTGNPVTFEGRYAILGTAARAGFSAEDETTETGPAPGAELESVDAGAAPAQ